MQHAMNARVKTCISRPKGVKCGRCHPFYSGTSCLRAGGVVLYRELGEPLRGMNGRGLG